MTKSILTITTKTQLATGSQVGLASGIAPHPSASCPSKAPPATSARPSTASTLYVVVSLALVIVFVGTVFWAAMVNAVGPPFSP